MVKIDEESLICDFAESYHIYDWRSLNLLYASILASGLRDNSRIKMKMSGIKYSLDTLLLASANDRLAYLLWMNTKDGQKNRNRPKSIYDLLMHEPKENEYAKGLTIDEFERKREQILASHPKSEERK